MLILLDPPVNGGFVATIDRDGDARGHGAVHIRDGTSNTILVADGSADASCADTDGDDTAGLARLSFGLREVRTGARFTAEVSPVNGNIDHQGRVKVKFPDLGADGDPLEIDGWLKVNGPGRSSEQGNSGGNQH